jgi:hypothetical protein
MPTPKYKLPKDQEALLLRALNIGISKSTIVSICKDLCEKNSFPWAEAKYSILFEKCMKAESKE